MRKSDTIRPFYDPSNDSQLINTDNWWVSNDTKIKVGSKVGAVHDAKINGKTTTITINGTVKEIKPSKKDGSLIYKIVRDDGSYLWVRGADITTERKNNLDEVVSKVIRRYINERKQV